MCSYDDDTYEVYSRRMVAARKEHACFECSRAIPRGTRYERAKGLYDGRWDLMTTCARCVEARRWIDVICSGAWSHGQLDDDIYQHVDELDCAPEAVTWAGHLVNAGMAEDDADEMGDALADRYRSWTPHGAIAARLRYPYRHNLSPDDVRELAQQAIEAWRELEPA